MNKRGQVTIFVIIGIVLIILILLLLFLKDKVYLGPATQEKLAAQLPQIREHIEECILKVSVPRFNQIALQGGFINTPEDTFRQYQGQRVSYLCYDIEDLPFCRSRVLTKTMMEKELSELIKKDLQLTCLNLNAFNKIGYDLTQGNLNIKTLIQDDSVLVTAKLPVKISKGALKVEESEFSTKVDVPLGRLYDSSRDIVSSEALIGVFDPLTYSLAKTQLTSKPYIIQKLQPYPDKLYRLKIKDTPSEDDEFIFQFFIEGEPR